MTSIKVNNIKINYIKQGKGQPLIFMHGIFYDLRGYKNIIKILSKSYKVYAIDLPMHGKSQKPERYFSISDFSLILKKFTEKLKIKKPILCAHSASCLIALDYAVKNNIKELILISPTGIPIYKSKFMILFNLALTRTLVGLFFNLIREFTVLRISMSNVFKNLFNKNFWRIFNKNYKKDFTDKMRNIKYPTKIVWANHDEIFNKKYAKEFKKRIKNSKIIIVNGSHDWPTLNPKEILKVL